MKIDSLSGREILYAKERCKQYNTIHYTIYIVIEEAKRILDN